MPDVPEASALAELARRITTSLPFDDWGAGGQVNDENRPLAAGAHMAVHVGVDNLGEPVELGFLLELAVEVDSEGVWVLGIFPAPVQAPVIVGYQPLPRLPHNQLQRHWVSVMPDVQEASDALARRITISLPFGGWVHLHCAREAENERWLILWHFSTKMALYCNAQLMVLMPLPLLLLLLLLLLLSDGCLLLLA